MQCFLSIALTFESIETGFPLKVLIIIPTDLLFSDLFLFIILRYINYFQFKIALIISKVI